MKLAGGTADLDGDERRSVRRRREKVAEEDTDGAEEVVLEDADGEDVDGDGGGIAGEEVGVNAEDEFVVPGRVLGSKTIDSGSELGVRVDPCDGVGLEAAESGGRGFEALGGDQVDLQEVGGLSCRRWKGRRTPPHSLSPSSLSL